MVIVRYSPEFRKKWDRLKDASLKERVVKQVAKVVREPEVGKPMRFFRTGTREVYVQPFRLSYSYVKDKGLLMFLDLYHKDEQ